MIVKSALIVGVSTGMGKATARALLQRGLDVTLVTRDEAKLGRAVEALSPLGDVNSRAIALCDRAAVDAFAHVVRTQAEPIRYLVPAAWASRMTSRR
jgi:short-subunit dehydrogenase